MKKAIIAILLATLTLAACTKEDTKKWIDGTSWKYSYRNDEGFKEECHLSLRNNGGEASYYNGFPPSYGYAYTDLRYIVKSYTYDGDKSGTIKLRGTNYYANDCTATFTLNYDQKKMSISCTDFSCTLERIK